MIITQTSYFLWDHERKISTIIHSVFINHFQHFIILTAYLGPWVQLLSHVQLFAAPRTAAHQALLSLSVSLSLLKLTFSESVMPSNHLVLLGPFSSCPQSFPVSGSFPMSQLFTSGGQSIGATSVLPIDIQS